MLTLYSKNNCAGCLRAAALLNDYEIPYTVVKIDENASAKDFVLSKGHRMVPVIYTDKGQEFVKDGYTGLFSLGKEKAQQLYENNKINS